MVFSEAKLFAMQSILGYKKVIKSFINKFSKLFTKDWECRNRSIIFKLFFVIFLVNGGYFSSLKRIGKFPDFYQVIKMQS